ncbi:hypothetical protein I4U23_027399 [Adineta vaga]|nr:hypothetical protein I4U23_027399 [Adineta vaga]
MNCRVSEEDAVLTWLVDNNEQRPPIDRDILQTVIADVRVFSDPKEFIQCLAALYDEQVFVVLDQWRTSVLNELNDFSWILCIYLQGPYDECANDKVRGSNLDLSELFLLLARDVTIFRRPSTHLTYRVSNKEASSHFIREQEARLVWSQLLLQAILTIPAPESKSAYDNHKDAIDECFRFYQGDTTEQNRIRQFGSSYTPPQAIYWYTLDAFLYRVLNRALRTQNILVIYKFRYILQDVYRQLKQLWLAQQATHTKGQSICWIDIIIRQFFFMAVKNKEYP